MSIGLQTFASSAKTLCKYVDFSVLKRQLGMHAARSVRAYKSALKVSTKIERAEER